MTSSFLLGRHPLSSATTFGEFEVFGKSVGFYLLNLRRHIFAYFCCKWANIGQTIWTSSQTAIEHNQALCN